MDSLLIVQPVVAMFLLTAMVWVFMYVRRLGFILSNEIDPQSIASPETLNARLPEAINNPSNNLKNLFELPVIFYALSALLIAIEQVDQVYVYAAWAFVGVRVIHSVIQCTVNIVNLRFAAYMLSSFVLWFMVLRLALSAF